MEDTVFKRPFVGPDLLKCSALSQFLRTLSEDEHHILVSSQFTLQRHREITQLFIDGILGYNFQRPLSFYLSRYEEYLEEVKRLIFTTPTSDVPDIPLPRNPKQRIN